ncbi:hypothetical protein IAD21_00794 [Abditibacteriota bacterium]|nr:hypothetical protein IAD21_00794 [Abditibacteriota bacterium]
MKALFPILLLALSGAAVAQTRQSDPVALVNPLMGTSAGGGALSPAACLPYSMVKLAPDTTRPSTAGYNSDEPIIGFSHTHIGGTGGNAFAGQILVRPQTGGLDVTLTPSPKTDEFASPGYYTVQLTRDNVKAELTATERAGIHRYTFPPANAGRILIDVSATINNASVEKPSSICTGSQAHFVSPREIEGQASFVGGYAQLTYTVYFVARFDQTPIGRGAWLGTEAQPGATEIKGDKGQRAGLFAEFAPQTAPVGLRVGLSYSSLDNARRHLAVSDGMSFEQVKTRAEDIWRKHLNTIQIEGGTLEQRRLFETCLYDFALAPIELTGDNAAWSEKEPSYWDIYCLWDTFRSAGPLATLIHPRRQEEILRSLLEVYRQTGWLPDAWAYNKNAFSIQGGTNADALFADAIAKGLGGFDRELAYSALKKNATVPSPSKQFPNRGRLAPYFTLGYVPATPINVATEYSNPTSATLEYAYNDFCVAKVAQALGHEEDARQYFARSERVFDLFYPDTKFFWAKDAAGQWLPDFDPKLRQGSWKGPFYEGSPWNYRFSTPHDVQGLINRIGGPAAFVAALDENFDGGHDYHGNEPVFLTPWLYDYAGRPDKVVDRVRAILQKDHHLAPKGYAGDEDTGAMSSWYVFGAMGFYPNAGQDVYLLGSPIFSQVRLQLDGGKTFTITANNLSENNRYVQSAKLNGKSWNQAWFRHRDIIGGAELVLQMGPQPSQWGTQTPPPSLQLSPQVANVTSQ